VQRAGDKFLARAALAVDGDGAGQRGDSADHVEHFLEGAAVADHVLDARAAGLVLAQGSVFALEALLVDGALDAQLDLVVLEGLLDIVKGAEAHGLDSALDGAVCGHHDGRRSRGRSPGATRACACRPRGRCPCRDP
jgi:hypothetical protein